jgi:DNA repair protein RecO (recombination protein O)
MRIREPAICLRAIDYSETSQIVTFLTRGEGVVRLMAKGTKRPKSKSGGMIDLLAEGELVCSLSDHTPDALGTLMEFTETATHRLLRREAGRLYTGVYMLELVDAMLAPGDPHPDVFDLLARSLERLSQPDAPTPAVLAWFQWRLLRHAGLLGGLGECVGCGMDVGEMLATQKQAVSFSSLQGGLLCDGCEGGVTEKVRISRNALAGLGALAATESGRRVTLPEAQAQAVNKLLAYHITHQLGKPLKMTRYALGSTPPARPHPPGP